MVTKFKQKKSETYGEFSSRVADVARRAGLYVDAPCGTLCPMCADGTDFCGPTATLVSSELTCFNCRDAAEGR